jgi:hypothetical protein
MMNARFTSLTLLLGCALSVAPGATQTPKPTTPPVPPAVVFAGLVGGANPDPQAIDVPNTGSPGSTLAVTTAQPSWLQVTVTNAGPHASVKFSVNLAGLAANAYKFMVEIKSTDKSMLVKKILVMLATFPPPPPNDSAYKVELRYTGYTGLASGYPDCDVNPAGFDVLTGIVTGREAVSPGDDVVYRGALDRYTAIDFCGTRGKRQPDDDERVWCAASLIGIATMNVQLEVYGEAGRGGYLHASSDGSWSTSDVQGTCAPAEMAQWERDYPAADDGGGGSPNGQPIDEALSGTARLFAGGRARLAVGTFPPSDPKQDGWTLEVMAKLK